jgi:hypothetical protein
MPGARCARSLACKIKKHTSLVTTVTPESPGIPRAMVLTVSFVLSPVTGLFCHRHRAVARQLDASVGASGPHDFAVRVRVARPARRRVYRIPPPTSGTIAKRPSEEAGPNRYIADFTPPSSKNSENQKFVGVEDANPEMSEINRDSGLDASRRPGMTEEIVLPPPTTNADGAR